MAKTEMKPKTKMVYLTKESRNDDGQFVGVNGKRYLVKKGQSVEVPIEVAEVIEAAEQRKILNAKFIEENARD